MRILNEISVRVLPLTEAGSVGEEITSESIVVKNALPNINSLIIGPSAPNELQDIIASWEFFDFDLSGLGDQSQENMSRVDWYRKNIGEFTFEKIVDQSSLSGISTDIGAGTSIISSSITSTGQSFYLIVTGNDSLDDGIPVTSPIVTVGPSTY